MLPIQLSRNKRGLPRRGSSLKTKRTIRQRASRRVLDVVLLRKEVIQPHLPIRLPCYDFTPIICPTFGGVVPKRGSNTDFGCYRLSWCDGRCVQGPGTNSPRHADPR